MGEPVAAVVGAEDTPPGKVLVALSASNSLQLASGKLVRTGHFLNELCQPIFELMRAGYEVEVGAGCCQAACIHRAFCCAPIH